MTTKRDAREFESDDLSHMGMIRVPAPAAAPVARAAKTAEQRVAEAIGWASTVTLSDEEMVAETLEAGDAAAAQIVGGHAGWIAASAPLRAPRAVRLLSIADRMTRDADARRSIGPDEAATLDRIAAKLRAEAAQIGGAS